MSHSGMQRPRGAKAAHVIRKVLLRQIAILNYVWPY
jgi:hypothetical protein